MTPTSALGGGRSRKGAFAAVAALVLASASGAAASVLGSSADQLAGGSGPVVRCGSLASATVGFVSTAGSVVQVKVTGLPSACNGAALTVTLASAVGVSLALGAATISGGAATVTALSVNPLASDVASVHLNADLP